MHKQWWLSSGIQNPDAVAVANSGWTITEGRFDGDVGVSDLQAWTSRSLSTQSGRLPSRSRSRIISPSVGSIRLNTGGPTQGRGAIASPISEEENPVQYEDGPKSAPKSGATDSKCRKVGAKKFVHGVPVSVELPQVVIVGAEFEDAEQETANSNPSQSDDGLPSDQVAKSPAKKRKKESSKKKARTSRVTQGWQTRSAANNKLLR